MIHKRTERIGALDWKILPARIVFQKFGHAGAKAGGPSLRPARNLNQVQRPIQSNQPKENKLMKKILSLLLLALSAASLQATVLLQDSTNYPYINGPIAGQGRWYVYDPSTPTNDTLVSNNVIYLKSTNFDSVATPTNGFYTPTNGTIVYASFTINVNLLPLSTADGYFCTFISTNKNYCCNVFVSSTNSVVPGTYRLSIANYSVSFSNLDPPVPFAEDLATNVTY